MRSGDRNANSGSQNRRLGEAEYYIICVLRLNYASACGESLKVTAAQHSLPIAKVTVANMRLRSGLVLYHHGFWNKVVTELRIVHFVYFCRN